jgi:hypothetical protein
MVHWEKLKTSPDLKHLHVKFQGINPPNETDFKLPAGDVHSGSHELA